jgi:hypothetical protein
MGVEHDTLKLQDVGNDHFGIEPGRFYSFGFKKCAGPIKDA